MERHCCRRCQNRQTLPSSSKEFQEFVALFEQNPGIQRVLLHGETGSGKTLFAKILHERRHLKSAFVPVNCANIPEQLFEATLFGARKGAC